LSILI